MVQQEAALGTPWRGKGGVWDDALGTPWPLLTLPTLTSSHKFIPSKFKATKLWETCFGGKAEDLWNYFLSLSSLHMGLPLLPPLASFKAFIHRSLWRKWSLFVPHCRWQLRERKIYVTCPTSPWKSLAEICTPVSNIM